MVEIVAPRARARATPTQTQLCDQFAAALTHYQAGRRQAAAEQFQTLLQQHPKDGPSRFYLQRCLTASTEPINSQKTGVIRFMEK